MEDQALIEQFAQHGSESAFAELTQRYEGFVFSTAFRQLGDADLARDVVQNVFLCVARKAGSLREEQVLAGWLGRTTRFEALKVLRERGRRAKREQAFMADVTRSEVSMPDDSVLLEEVQDGLQRLSVTDRQALTLRFSEGRSLKEAAIVLGISEDAAQKRISRALEKLRGSVAKRRLSSAALAALLGTPSFSASVTATTASTVTTASAPILGALTPLLAMAKLNVITITAAVAVLTATPLVVYYLRDNTTDRPAAEIVSSRPTEISPVENKEAAAARAEADALRAELASLRSELADKAKPQEVETPAPDPITVLRQRVLNGQNDPQDRLNALRELRDRNGRDAQVAAAMAMLARTTTDPRIRADIFRQLNGMKDPSLKPVLMEALQRDASDEVRQEAAETLADHGGDPAVAALLATVSRTDKDPEVRGQAVEALVKNAPADVLQRIQNDPQATDLEIYHSTSALRQRLGANESQAALLLNVLNETKIPNLRKEIVEDLGKHYGSIPAVAEWMNHLAQTEQDPKVRREAEKFTSP